MLRPWAPLCSFAKPKRPLRLDRRISETLIFRTG